MRNWWPVLVKFVMVLVILYIVESIFYADYTITFISILATSFVVTVIAYLLGDRYILPRYGNISSTLADFVIAWIVIWAFGNLWYTPVYPWASIAVISALILAVGEWFFHKYLVQHIKIK